MAVELKVPEAGESITEAQVGEWLKSKGESVERDEPVVTLETDKTTLELPAPVSGTITEVVVEAGETVEIGEVIGYMEEGEAESSSGGEEEAKGKTKTEEDEAEGDDGKARAKKKSKRAPKDREGAEEDTTDAGEKKKKKRGAAKGAAKKGKRKNKRKKSPTSSWGTAKKKHNESAGDKVRVDPEALHLLEEHELPAADIEATGPDGRLLEEDVRRHLQGLEKSEEGETREVDSKAAVEEAYRDEEIVAMSPMRRRIAERLVEAKQQSALLTTFNEIDMTRVIELRRSYQESFREKYEIKLGFMSFFVKALVEALKDIPRLNAEIRGTDIAYRHYYDIGIAIGGGKGLVVPVLRNAERMSFAEIEIAIDDFARRAQENDLELEELQGGTFTISNGGVYGSLLSTPIVNPPQSGILGLHAIQERPVARDGKVVIRPMMYVAVTYDHRIVDGREAVTFLKRIQETIEDPSRILIEV